MTDDLRLDLVLPATDPATWLGTHLGARYDEWEAEAALHPDAAVGVATIADLVAGNAAPIGAAHRRIVDRGTPPQAAATYLAEWYAGAIAGAVGYGLATAGAGFVLDPTGAGPGVLLHLHPDGWPFRVELPAAALVLADHPWAGLEDVEVEADARQLLARTVGGLVAAVAPLVEACHGLARVGVVGLWNEVADALGKAVAFQHAIDPTPTMVAVLDAACRVPGVPWRARPRLGFAESARLGAVHVAQKGGCCLAYTGPLLEEVDADDPTLEPYHRAYLARFPDDPEQPHYCSTCSFRDAADCDARQVFWHEHHR